MTPPLAVVARFALALLLPAALAGCSQSAPRAVAYGEESCGFCRMTISDPRYGGELITSKGKVHTFDSIECLASFYLEGLPRGDVRSIWVSDYHRPGTWVPADKAVFARGGSHHSPMGLDLVATAPSTDTTLGRPMFDGEPLRWTDVLALVAREGKSLAEQGAANAHR